MNKLLATLFCFILSWPALAIVDGHEYPFEESTKADLFKQLAEELRCPKCQNQNLADSNAMIAGDLRRELYQQVKQGKTQDEIKEFMVDRYGEFVLYKPKVSNMTYVLWFGPAVLLFLAVLSFVLVVRKRKLAEQQKTKDTGLTDTEQTRLHDLLDDETDTDRDNS